MTGVFELLVNNNKKNLIKFLKFSVKNILDSKETFSIKTSVEYNENKLI